MIFIKLLFLAVCSIINNTLIKIKYVFKTVPKELNMKEKVMSLLKEKEMDTLRARHMDQDDFLALVCIAVYFFILLSNILSTAKFFICRLNGCLE